MSRVNKFKKEIVDGNDDDVYCEALYQEYLSTLEEDKEVVSLEDMNQAINNFKRGSVSPEIDLSDVEEEDSKKKRLNK